jgi:hypothetical protein
MPDCLPSISLYGDPEKKRTFVLVGISGQQPGIFHLDNGKWVREMNPKAATSLLQRITRNDRVEFRRDIGPSESMFQEVVEALQA